MRSSIYLASAAALAFLPLSAQAQDHAGHHGHDMAQPESTRQQSNTSDWRFNQNCQIIDDNGEPIMANCVRYALYADGSGTARQPGREGHHRHGNVLNDYGGWTVMAHGFVSTQYTDHSGPRGRYGSHG